VRSRLMAMYLVERRWPQGSVMGARNRAQVRPLAGPGQHHEQLARVDEEHSSDGQQQGKKKNSAPGAG